MKLRKKSSTSLAGSVNARRSRMVSSEKSNPLDEQEGDHGGMRCSVGLAYLFFYYLLQFCGHTWIFCNMTAMFLSFGSDALVGTFYSVGVMMSLCQLLSVLEVFHIADEIVENRLLPRFVQVVERNFVLFLIISQEEFQSKTIVCMLFYLWSIVALLRYPYELLCLISTPSFPMLWVRYSICIPIYILSVITEGVTVLQALPYYEAHETYCVQLETPLCIYIHFPYLLMAYLPLLAIGAGLTIRILLNERKLTFDIWNKKRK